MSWSTSWKNDLFVWSPGKGDKQVQIDVVQCESISVASAEALLIQLGLAGPKDKK